MRRLLLLLLLSLSLPALAQSYPTTPQLKLQLPPRLTGPGWGLAVNSNSVLIDNLFPSAVCGGDGIHAIGLQVSPNYKFSCITVGGVPGGSPNQIQFNSGGIFNGIFNDSAGKVLTSNGPGALPSFQISLPLQSGQTPGSLLRTDGSSASWQAKPVCNTRDVAGFNGGTDLGSRIIACDIQLGGTYDATQQGNLAYNTTITYGTIRVDPADVGPITTFPVFISAGHNISLGAGRYQNALGSAQPILQLADYTQLECDGWNAIIENSSNVANADPRVIATASAYQVITGVGQNNVPYAKAHGVHVKNCHFQDSGTGKLSTLTATVVYTNCIDCKDINNFYDGIGVTGVGLIGGFYSGPNCTNFANWLAQYCGNFGSGDEIVGDVFRGTQEAISVINNEHVDIHDVKMSKHATGAAAYIDLESNTPKDHMQFIDIHDFIMDCSTPQINTGCFGVTMQSVGPNTGHLKIHDGIVYGPAPGTALSGQTTSGISSGDFNPHGTHEVEIYNMKISQTSNPGISVAGVDYAYVHDNQEVCTGGGIAVFDFAQYSLFKNNRFVAPPRTDYTITSVATTADQATTVYTGTFADGGAGALASQTVNITGFTNALNNGSFGVSTSTTTTLTVYNPAGVAETHAAIGSIGCSPSLGTDQNNTQINETSVTADFNTYEGNTGSGQILLKGPHSQIAISQAADRTTNAIGRTFGALTGFANAIPGGMQAAALTPPVLNTSGPTTNTCVVTFTSATYFWIVTAVAPNGGQAPSNEVSQIAGGGSGCAKLGWTYVPGAASYNVTRGTASGNELLMINVPQGTLGYTDGGGQTPGAAVVTKNGSGVIGLQSVLFANLPTALDGVMLYCSDCKNVTDDTTGTFDSVAAGSGHGTMILRENGAWRVH